MVVWIRCSIVGALLLLFVLSIWSVLTKSKGSPVHRIVSNVLLPLLTGLLATFSGVWLALEVERHNEVKREKSEIRLVLNVMYGTLDPHLIHLAAGAGRGTDAYYVSRIKEMADGFHSALPLIEETQSLLLHYLPLTNYQFHNEKKRLVKLYKKLTDSTRSLSTLMLPAREYHIAATDVQTLIWVGIQRLEEIDRAPDTPNQASVQARAIRELNIMSLRKKHRPMYFWHNSSLDQRVARQITQGFGPLFRAVIGMHIGHPGPRLISNVNPSKVICWYRDDDITQQEIDELLRYCEMFPSLRQFTPGGGETLPEGYRRWEPPD
jgi:hypothetical protein